jgi:hypothetical protein
MKNKLLLAIVLCAAGCVSTTTVRLDHTKRPHSDEVEVYKDSDPTRPYRAIAEISWGGPRSDEIRAQRHFMKQARKLGGDAILMRIVDADPLGRFRFPGPFGQGTDYVFTAKVIVYQ